MAKPLQSILQIPQIAEQCTLGYRKNLNGFLDGRIDPAEFKAMRIMMGIYQQRTKGRFMVRIRIGAGLVLPFQMERIAELSKKYGDGNVHITTRQDIQIHLVRIEDTPDILEGLLEVKLTTYGGGANTVRNITACPEAGVCPKEQFDVAPYAIAVAEYLLQDKISVNLPRKFKIVFSGCSQDCAFASVADVGFFAHMKDGKKGFAVYAAGGLGSEPAVAVKIEDFIRADEVFEVALALRMLFDKNGDRANRNKARLRYVLARSGFEAFMELYRDERKKLKLEPVALEVPQIRDISLRYPAPQEHVSIRVTLENGLISADSLRKIIPIAVRYGQGLLRTTQSQDILITAVAAEDSGRVNSELMKLGIRGCSPGKGKIVACTGSSVCKLGFCCSRGLSKAISERLSGAELADTTIRISGCRNSCAQHHISTIGFQGKFRRVNGRVVPCYDVLAGAKISQGRTQLAEKIGTLPARIIPDLIADVFGNGTITKESICSIVDKYTKAIEDPLPDEYYDDWY